MNELTRAEVETLCARLFLADPRTTQRMGNWEGLPEGLKRPYRLMAQVAVDVLVTELRLKAVPSDGFRFGDVSVEAQTPPSRWADINCLPSLGEPCGQCHRCCPPKSKPRFRA